ncbi:MAG: AAA family ATPase [Candidatus Algichlamydia australiensis]|nr:AAA family ATPase [Chlamydiales bacterium]
MATSSIIKSLPKLVETVKAIFPDSKVEELALRASNSVQIRFQLANSLPPLSIENAVAKKEFIEVLTHLRGVCDRLEIGIPTITSEIDSTIFTVQLPLINWEIFQREEFESRGGDCAQYILIFLRENAGVENLMNLGLAPQQIDRGDNGQALTYFREVLRRINSLPEASNSGELLNKLRDCYPSVWQNLLIENAKKRMQEIDAGIRNHYQEYLCALNDRVIGQAHATERVSEVLTTQKTGDATKVFIFCGPSGVGKTELAKAISGLKSGVLVRLDMQEYIAEHTYSNLFGSPTGYVGSTDKPKFAKKLDLTNPKKITCTQSDDCHELYEVTDAVILFDEFEKAHHKVRTSLLTVFDEKVFSVGFTRASSQVTLKYKFKNCVLIATSNLLQGEILKAFTLGKSIKEITTLFVDLNKQLPQGDGFPPELLGRMELIPFRPVSRGENFQKILGFKLDTFIKILKKDLFVNEVRLKESVKILELLEDQLYVDGTNIRAADEYFDKVKGRANKNKDKWGSLDKVRLTISVKEDKPLINVSLFIEEMREYWEVEEFQFFFPEF